MVPSASMCHRAFGITLGLYHHYADRARTLDGVALYRTSDLTITGDGEPERIRVARVTPSLALGPARVARARSLVHGGGRCAWRRTGGRAVARDLDATVRRRPAHPRPASDARWRAGGGDRRHARRPTRSPIRASMCGLPNRFRGRWGLDCGATTAWRGCATARRWRMHVPS